MLLVAAPSLKLGSSNSDSGDCCSILLHSKTAYGRQNSKMAPIVVGDQPEKQNQ